MIQIQDGRLKDEFGRTLILHGVNLGGSSKVPSRPDGASWNRESFYDHRPVSFVGRPFPLSEADEHFQRLRAWGFTFLRFLITWEAIEHAGPGIYDEEYLDYLYQVIRKAGEYGIDVLIDPHQDVWSRFTGGDGAPGWTLEVAGFDLAQLHATGAALLHQEHGDPYPPMIWPTNYSKLAAATMFTLFFGGDDFAPQLRSDGVPIQKTLQGHYIEAVKQVARRLKDLPNVIGYEAMNEPSAGFIGAEDLDAPVKYPLWKGDTPTIFQSMLLGAGYPQQVDVYGLTLRGFVKKGRRLANPHGQRAWKAGREDIWEQGGAWGLDADSHPRILAPDYFCVVGGRRVDFLRDYFKPFANRFAREIRTISPQALLFVEGVPQEAGLSWGAGDAPGFVHAPHWYDGITLMTKTFRRWVTVHPRTRKIVLGRQAVRRCLAGQIGEILCQSEEWMDGLPVLIGEVGIPFDMQGKRAYRTKDFSVQVEAMDASLSALDANLASYCLWNYTPDNTNARGDQWNGEDLSIFSRDQAAGGVGIHAGGRALPAIVRPYPRKTAGQPVHLSFDYRKKLFEFSFRHDPGIHAPTEIFLPEYQYPDGFQVEVSDGTVEVDREGQILRFCHTGQREIHFIRVTPG